MKILLDIHEGKVELSPELTCKPRSEIAAVFRISGLLDTPAIDQLVFSTSCWHGSGILWMIPWRAVSWPEDERGD